MLRYKQVPLLALFGILLLSLWVHPLILLFPFYSREFALFATLFRSFSSSSSSCQSLSYLIHCFNEFDDQEDQQEDVITNDQDSDSSDSDRIEAKVDEIVATLRNLDVDRFRNVLYANVAKAMQYFQCVEPNLRNKHLYEKCKQHPQVCII